jgi:hypothetical protein
MARNPPLTPSEPDLEIQIEGRFEYRALVSAGYADRNRQAPISSG